MTGTTYCFDQKEVELVLWLHGVAFEHNVIPFALFEVLGDVASTATGENTISGVARVGTSGHESPQLF